MSGSWKKLRFSHSGKDDDTFPLTVNKKPLADWWWIRTMFQAAALNQGWTDDNQLYISLQADLRSSKQMVSFMWMCVKVYSPAESVWRPAADRSGVGSDVYLLSKERCKLILMRPLTHRLQRRWHQSANQCLADVQRGRSAEAAAHFLFRF